MLGHSITAEYPIGCIAQVPEYRNPAVMCRREQVALLGTASCHDKNWPALSPKGRFNVRTGVTYQVAGPQVEIKRHGSSEKHSGRRLAALTPVSRLVWTPKYAINATAMAFDFPKHISIDFVNSGVADQAATHSRLIRHHDDFKPQRQSRDGVEDTPQKLELAGAFHVVAPVNVDNAIPIEEDRSV